MVVLFEGHDGCGKTTLIRTLKKKLIDRNRSVTIISCPSPKKINLRNKVVERDNLESSFKFYVGCCKDTSARITSLKGHVDYILLDRYYYSTIVSHKSRNFPVDISRFETLEEVDIKFWIQVNEKERLKRLLNKDDLDTHDLKTINKDLIRRANSHYSKYNFININNDRKVKDSIDNILNKIKNRFGRL